MTADGYLMPKPKSAFLTLPLIYRVRRKEVWFPRKEDIREIALCARPPPVKQLVAFIKEVVSARVYAGYQSEQQEVVLNA